MGQKTNPIGLRIAVNHDWRSKWYAGKKEFGKLLTEDREIRDLLKKKLESASVPQILIERAASRCRITILTARPGIVIGRKGAEIDKLKEELSKMTGKEIYVDIVEVKTPEIDAQLVAENVALQLERRVSFRRAMKKALQTAKDFGAEGIKIRCAGRLGGAELARVEQYHWGRVPLHTLRANIDYGFAEANTVYGKLGIKCWICKGDTKPQKPAQPQPAAACRCASDHSRFNRDFVMPLMPERVKYRKMHRGNRAGLATRGQTVAFGEYGLMALERCWLDTKQIEAARVAIARNMKRHGKMWIRIFPQKSFTKKPLETRMGKGKGPLESWVAVIRPANVLFEVDGVTEAVARESLRLAATKLPIKTKFISRHRDRKPD